MPCPSQTWSLSDSQYPAQHSCSCALGTSLALTGQGKPCWCPLEGQQVTAWCAESENRVLSFPVLGYAHVLQVLCNPVGKFAQRGHFWEFRSQPKVSVAGDLMRFCHLVASVPVSSKDCSVQSQPQGTIVFLVPRDKLAVVAAVEGFPRASGAGPKQSVECCVFYSELPVLYPRCAAMAPGCSWRGRSWIPSQRRW